MLNRFEIFRDRTGIASSSAKFHAFLSFLADYVVEKLGVQTT